MRQFTFLFITLLIVNGQPGVARTTGAQFLLDEHHSRVVGLGGAFVALADDGDAIYWNPAGLSQLVRPILTLTHYQGFIGTTNEYVNIVYPLGRFGALGADVFYSSVSDVTIYDDFGLKSYELANYDLVMDAAWGLAWKDHMSLGLGLKYYQSKLAEYIARGVAADIGILARDYPWKNLSFGCALQNIGPGAAYIKVSDPLPLNLKVGPAYKLNFSSAQCLKLSTEVNYLIHERWLYLNNGLEYGFQERYFIRGGYRVNRTYDKLSCGLGVRLANVIVNYAFQPFGHLGLTHRVSLSLEPLKKRKKESVSESIVKVSPTEEPTPEPTIEPTSETLSEPQPKKIRHEYAFSFAGDLLFAQGEAKLRPRAHEALAGALTAIDERYPESYVMVAGHTDNIPWLPGGRFKNNYELSLARADAVRKFFISKGMNPLRLSIVGYGETIPVAGNETDEGRTANRRVELVIYGEKAAGVNDLIVEGKLLAEQGDVQAGLVRLLKAAELDPGNAKAHLLIGYCYSKLGQKGKARQIFEKSLQLNPDDKKLRDFLEKWE